MVNITNECRPDYGFFVEKQIRFPSFYMSYKHDHNYCEIFYLKTGKCIYHVEDMKIPLNSGDFLIVPAKHTHYTSYEGEIPCERVIICCQRDSFPKEFVHTYPEILEMLEKPCKATMNTRNRRQIELLIQQILQENQLPDAYSYESMRYLILSLLLSIKRFGIFAEFIPGEKKYDKDISTATEYIIENYAQSLTLEEIAMQAGLSPTYFSKKFHLSTGKTFKEYVNDIRIRQARQMLLTTDDSITKIAISCGFSSSNYFKDIFRRATGISPRNYRKQRGKNNI